MLLYYIRHGNPIYDPDSLTPLGERQAEAVARRLCTHGLDRIFASTSTRAQLTAQPTCEILQKEMTLLDFTNENHAWRDFHIVDDDGAHRWAFCSKKLEKVFASREVFEMGRDWYDHPLLKEYGFKKGVDRIDTAIDELLLSLGYRHDREKAMYEVVNDNHERIALFAHQGFGMSFMSSVLDIPYPQFATHFDMCHSGITVINFSNNGGVCIPKVLMVSSDAHIYGDRLPTKYNNEIFI